MLFNSCALRLRITCVARTGIGYESCAPRLLYIVSECFAAIVLFSSPGKLYPGMGLFKWLVRLVVFAILTVTVGVVVINWKGAVLGSKIAACPSAINGMYDLLEAVTHSESLIQNIWDCSIGVLLYIALPGIGINWFLTKHIIK